VTPKTLEELAIPGIPQLCCVIPACAGNHGAVRGELNVVDLVLVTQLSSVSKAHSPMRLKHTYQTRNRLGAIVVKIPEVHGEVVTFKMSVWSQRRRSLLKLTRRDESLGYLALNLRRVLEALLGL